MGRWVAVEGVGRAGRAALWAIAWAVWLAVVPAMAGTIVRVDVDNSGNEATAPALGAVISGEGRYVAFASNAHNLVADDTSFSTNVFLYDRQTATVVRVSHSAIGGEVDGDSDSPAISADGRFVAFASRATNPLLNDLNGVRDVFLWDRNTGAISLVSFTSSGGQSDGDSDAPTISADGRFVAFTSDADNLVPGDTNLMTDVFLTDTRTGGVSRVSVDSSGNEADGGSFAPSLSADGSTLAFSSEATTLVSTDTNSARDIFVVDLATNAVTLASVSSAGVQANGNSDEPSLNADGSIVAFSSVGTNLVTADTNGVQDVFVRNLTSGFTTRESIASDRTAGDGDSGSPALNPSGRFLAFSSLATDLVSSDTNGASDVFVRDRLTHLTVRVSVASDGTQADADSFAPSLTGDGREVAFLSGADNLVASDTNSWTDVFVYRWVSFPDVPPEFPAFQQIEAAVTAGVVRGFADGLYHPEIDVTRAQMAIFLARALAGGEDLVPAGPTTATFSDVPTTFPAFRHIEFLNTLGVAKGFGDGTFGPALLVNRAQMAVFLARALAGGDANVPPGPADPTFSDVPTTFWAFRHIEFLAGQGIVLGFSDGLYHPELMVTRAQMALFIARAFALPLPGA
jgi:Tol biopolymer transport system component